jgi:hypothetical protein
VEGVLDLLIFEQILGAGGRLEYILFSAVFCFPILLLLLGFELFFNLRHHFG